MRLWLKSAPSVTAVDQAGWLLAPPSAETNATWLKRLKAIYPEEPGSPWKPLLEDVKAGVARSGVELLSAKSVVTVKRTGDTTVFLSGTGSVEATFAFVGGAWTTDSIAKLDAWTAKIAPGVPSGPALYRYAGAKPPAGYRSEDAWNTFISAVIGTTTRKPLIFESEHPVIVETVPPPPKLSPAGPANFHLVPTNNVAQREPEPAPFPWLPVALAGLVGAGAGFAVRHAMRPKKAAAPPDESGLRRRLAESVAEAERLGADLERAKSALTESNRSAKQYREEHSSWLRDRDETVRSLQEERKAHAAAAARAGEVTGLLKAAEDAKNRTEAEMGGQIRALQGKVQSQEGRASALATKARAYAGLHHEVMDAFNFLQGEIGRPEVAAVVGYLLNYSVANLMDTLLAPNPALERAMLSNVARIAGCVSNLPHVRKAAATADALLQSLGAGPIPESASPHPYATHIGGLLRVLRNQMNVELAPFYVAVDGEGKAHAVYI